MSAELKEELKGQCLELGFVRFGVAEATKLEREGAFLDAWLAEGSHGTMGWMDRAADVRADPRLPGMVSGARSVIALVTPYARAGGPIGPKDGGRVAAYARGRDYHNVITRRIRKVEKHLRALGFEARHSVDTRPVLERAWAQRSGVGFIGKNCCLIVPGVGSHVFLSCIITNAELPIDPPMKEKCGRCTACLDGCPTNAFVKDRHLEARKCVSYLTIESSDPIPAHLRSGVGEWLFGCDVCQDVCPYNRTSLQEPSLTEPFAANEARWDVSLGSLLSMDESTFTQWAQGSPLRRGGVAQLARNAAIVAGNTKQAELRPALSVAASEHSSEIVRDAASWALSRIDEDL